MTASSVHNIRPNIRLRGEVQPRFEQAALEVRVTMPPEGMAHAEIRLANWGATEDRGRAGFTFLDVALGDQIELELGGGTTQATVFDGEITAIEERYGSGAPQIVLLAEDRMHHMARFRRARSFEDMSIDDVLSILIQDVGLTPDVSVSSATTNVHQLNESNLALARRLAAPFGANLRLLNGNTVRIAAPEPTADPVTLDASDNATSVRVIADLNRQYTAATSAGYSIRTAEEVTHEASALAPAPSGTTAADQLGSLGWEGQAYTPQPPARSQSQADAFAEGAFAERAGRFVTAHVTCEGDPRLATGDEAELTGVSERFEGTYAIERCTHHFDTSEGYQVQLVLTRPDWNPS